MSGEAVTKAEWKARAEEWAQNVRNLIKRRGPSADYPENFMVHSPKGFSLTLELMWPILAPAPEPQ